eukprot:364373-Chlamydomonas_euryale.AAC.8
MTPPGLLSWRGGSRMTPSGPLSWRGGSRMTPSGPLSWRGASRMTPSGPLSWRRLSYKSCNTRIVYDAEKLPGLPTAHAARLFGRWRCGQAEQDCLSLSIHAGSWLSAASCHLAGTMALRGRGECSQDVILRQAPTISTKFWNAGSVDPPPAMLCLVPTWTHGLRRPPSGIAGQWSDKPNFDTLAPRLGRHLQVCNWWRSQVAFVTRAHTNCDSGDCRTGSCHDVPVVARSKAAAGGRRCWPLRWLRRQPLPWRPPMRWRRWQRLRLQRLPRRPRRQGRPQRLSQRRVAAVAAVAAVIATPAVAATESTAATPVAGGPPPAATNGVPQPVRRKVPLMRPERRFTFGAHIPFGNALSPKT